MAQPPRSEDEPRGDQLIEMIPKRPQLVKPIRHEVKKPAQRIRDGLSLVVIIEAGKLAPAGVISNLDEACTQHDPENEPAEQPEDQNWRWPSREWVSINQGTEEDRQKAGFEELDLPTVGVPILTNMDKGKIKQPEQCHEDRIGESKQHHE